MEDHTNFSYENQHGYSQHGSITKVSNNSILGTISLESVEQDEVLEEMPHVLSKEKEEKITAECLTTYEGKVKSLDESLDLPANEPISPFTQVLNRNRKIESTSDLYEILYECKENIPLFEAIEKTPELLNFWMQYLLRERCKISKGICNEDNSNNDEVPKLEEVLEFDEKETLEATVSKYPTEIEEGTILNPEL